MIYSDFIECENATIIITTTGEPVQNPITLEIEYPEVETFNNTGIFYELGASEQVARQQIQKGATNQVILNPSKVLTKITEDMTIYVSTDDGINKKFRIVTSKNPLGRNEAIIIDLVGGEDFIPTQPEGFLTVLYSDGTGINDLVVAYSNGTGANDLILTYGVE